MTIYATYPVRWLKHHGGGLSWLLASVIITLFFALLESSDHVTLQALQSRMEYISYDLRMNASLPRNPALSAQVVIAAIDDKSIQELGRWPWPRDRIAQLIDHLTQAKSAVIAFDMVFSEPENNIAQEFFEHPLVKNKNWAIPRVHYDAIKKALDNDTKLAHSLDQRDVVLSYILHNNGSAVDSRYQLPHAITTTKNIQKLAVPWLEDYTGNIPLLQNRVRYSGFMTTLRDDDGILRRSPMLLRYQNKLFPSLSLEVVRAYLLLDNIELETIEQQHSTQIENIMLGSLKIPVDQRAQLIIPYVGPAKSFLHVSASDIIAQRINPALFKDKIVLVGTTAIGLTDFVATPVQNVYPGVEVHANLIAGILNQRLFSQPGWARGVNFFLILCCGLVLIAICPRVGAVWQVLLALGMVIGIIGGNLWLWQSQGIVLSLATPLLLVVMLTLLYLTAGFIRETRKRHQLKSMFGQYVPPQIVEKLSKQNRNVDFGGDSKQMTVLFADIRNFTTISESLSPNELKQLLNRFFTHMTKIIFDHHGTIDKYVGDMIMAFWGAPVDNAQHAQHAVEAAFAMLKKVQELKAEFKSLGLPEINIGIGLNTGTMNVGDMGSEFRRAYTVLGDAVNLASRIEGLTKYYGAALLIGEDTEKELQGILCRPVDLVKVKGKTQPVRVFEPLCHTHAANTALTQELVLYQQALTAYLSQHWHQAHDIFMQLQQKAPNTLLYRVYSERIVLLQQRSCAETEQWDGVFERREK